MGDLVESFWLYGKDGARYRAYIHQERIDTTTLDGGPSSVPGLKTARLEHGPALNFVDENTFENVVTGELLAHSTRTRNKVTSPPGGGLSLSLISSFWEEERDS